MNIVLFSEEDKLKNSSDWFFTKDDERYKHIKKILKLSVGDVFKAGLINGKIGEGKILSFSDEKLSYSFTETKEPQPLPPIKLILGFPRPIQLKRILRDVASLGCAEIFLCGTELGEASYLKSGLLEPAQIRKYLLDGISQAGQSLLPKFSFYKSVKDCLESIQTENNQKILLDIDETAERLGCFDFAGEVILAIGSERGWTDNERKLFAETGFVKASMGKRILRTETATSASLAVCLSRL